MSQQPFPGQQAPQQGWGQPPAQQAPPVQYQQQAPAQQAPWPGTAQQAPAQQGATYQGGSNDDPFGAAKVPAVSWKDAPIGTTVIMEVTGPAEIVQSRDFETSKLEFWEPEYPGAAPQPKWSVVTNGLVNGEMKALWAAKTSKAGSLCRAIADAQTEAGFRVDAGTRLAVQFVGEEPPPPDRPRNSPRKLYRAQLQRGAPGGAGDHFAAAPAQQAAPAQAAPPVQYQQQAPAQAPAQQGPPDFAQPGYQGQQAPPAAPPQAAPQYDTPPY